MATATSTCCTPSGRAPSPSSTTDGNVVFDSGSEFEAIIADLFPERFNNDDGEPIATEDDNRSDAKGPEPEAVTVGEIDGTKLYAFIASGA